MGSFKKFLQIGAAAVVLLAGSGTKQSAGAFEVMFLQPPNVVPVPWLSDATGIPYVWTQANTVGYLAATSVYASTALETSTPAGLVGKHVIVKLLTTPTVNGYVILVDATAVPADGAITQMACYQVYSGGTYAFIPDIYFATGPMAIFSTTGCFTKTASATATFTMVYQ